MFTDFRFLVFKTVAELQSFTKAAAELYITQPAVTKHISELERQIGDPLFVRHGSSITLTPKGVLLLDQTLQVLASYKALNDVIFTETETFEGWVNFGASTTVSQYLLPQVLAQLKKRYPNVHISLFNGNSRQIEELIKNGKLDLGIIEGCSQIPTLHYDLFMEDELLLVTAAGKKSARKKSITLDELKQLPLIIRENGSGTLDIIEQALEKQGFARKDLNIEMQLGSTESIKHYLYNSETFAFISVRAIIDELKEGKLQVVNLPEMPITRNFRFVSPHGQRSKLVETFKQFCLSYYNQKL